MPSTSITIKDALGAVYSVAAENNGGTITTHSVPEVNGAPVGDTNPLPVTTRGGIATTMKIVPLAAGIATKLVSTKPGRRMLAVMNIGMNLATMGFANTITFGQGWALSAAGAVGDQGGGYEWSTEAVHVGEVWAISASPTTIVVLEG